MVLDYQSMDPAVQNEIDSSFYFGVYCDRWIAGVRALRLRYFKQTDPPEAWVQDAPDEVFLLEDPLSPLQSRLLRILDKAARRFDADVPPTRELKQAIGTIRLKENEVVRWWRAQRLGEPYGLAPHEVWDHILTGRPVRLPYLKYFAPPSASGLSKVIIEIYDPAALDYRGLGLKDDARILRLDLLLSATSKTH